MRARKLKVWAGADAIPGVGFCSDVIVAAHNQAEAARILKTKKHYIATYWSVTGNKEAIEVASAEPGVVFYRAKRGEPYQRKPDGK